MANLCSADVVRLVPRSRERGLTNSSVTEAIGTVLLNTGFIDTVDTAVDVMGVSSVAAVNSTSSLIAGGAASLSCELGDLASLALSEGAVGACDASSDLWLVGPCSVW